MQWFTIIAQLFDYVVKAIVHYKETEDGAKEWADFVDAYETAVQVDLDGDGLIAKNRPAPPAAQNTARRPAPRVVGEKTFVNTNAES